jgi:hypothetical protein
MRDGPLKGGPSTYGNGFLPAIHSATEIRMTGAPILYLQRPENLLPGDQRRIMNFSQQLNRRFLEAQNSDSNLAARIAAYELAYRMQTAAPHAVHSLNMLREHLSPPLPRSKTSNSCFCRNR